jgi:hypothetical protein
MNVWHSVKKDCFTLPIFGFVSDMSEVFDPCRGIRYKYGNDRVCGFVLLSGQPLGQRRQAARINEMDSIRKMHQTSPGDLPLPDRVSN